VNSNTPAWEQGKLFPIRGVVDLGPIGEGVSGARWLGVYDGQSLSVYAAKCSSDKYPYLLVNEAVCAAIADALQLPIPAFSTIVLDNQVWFGLEKKEPKVPYTLENLLSCVNLDQVPGILVFDVLVCNPDRHPGNAVLHRYQESPPALTLWIIDHSHALVGTRRSVSALVATMHSTSRFLRLPHHREVLQRRSQFDPFVDRVEAIDSTLLDEIMGELPKTFVPSGADLEALSSFLLARRDEVRSLIDTAFQNLPL
jgi:hypothetical protein